MKNIFQAIKVISMLGGVTNWKTTGIGLVAAIAYVIYDNMVRGVTDWKSIAFACIPAALGFLSKDADVSGGGTQKTITVESIKEDKISDAGGVSGGPQG